MIKHLCLCPGIMVLTLVPGSLLAQEYDYHPILSDRFTASLGAMRSSNSFDVEAGIPGDPGDYIDFNKSLGVSDHSSFFNGKLRWKFGGARKWILAGQYFSNDATGDAVLTEDVEWDGLTFREGSFVKSGVKLAVTRIFIGRSFIKNARTDFGAGIGLHNLDMNVFIEGDVQIKDMTTEFQRKEVSANQPLPNIGGWYNFSPAKRWLLHARVDWISANVGNYDGGLWNTSVGINYQGFRHVGFDLSWQYFNLNLKVDKTDWHGKVDMIYSGPVLAVTFGW